MKTLLVLSILACAAIAEPRVREDQYDVFDVASMKAGQWIETTDVTEHATADGKKDVSKRLERTACVKADDEFVWIEDTKWAGDKPEEKEVSLAQVRRSDRKAVKAWWGKPGAEGQELKLAEARKPRPARPGMESTGVVTTEKVKIDDKDVDAQKLVVTMTETAADKKKTTIFTVWLNADATLKLRFQDPAVLDVVLGPVKWDKKPTGPAGLLRTEVKAETWSSLQTVSGSGADAKATLTVK